MKANDKNYVIVEVEKQDFMDVKPDFALVSFKSIEDAQTWAKQMSKSYSGGTTRIVRELTPKSLVERRQSSYWKGFEDRIDNLALDAPQDFVDCYANILDNLNNSTK